MSKPDQNNKIITSLYEERNHEIVSAISFDKVERVEISDTWSGDYGRMDKTFYYDPASKTCESETKEDYMGEYSGDNEHASAILAMYDFGEEPEEIADLLGISVEEVAEVLREAGFEDDDE